MDKTREEHISGIVRRYGDLLYRTSFVLLKNEKDAEDAVQETLIEYMNTGVRFEGEEHEKAWLLRVAVNKSKDLLRYRARHPLLEESAEARTSTSDGTVASSPVLDALLTLPEKYRLALTLHYVEGYNVKETAQIMHLTGSAVKMRLKKGRELLKAAYRKEIGL